MINNIEYTNGGNSGITWEFNGVQNTMRSDNPETLRLALIELIKAQGAQHSYQRIVYKSKGK